MKRLSLFAPLLLITAPGFAAAEEPAPEAAPAAVEPAPTPSPVVAAPPAKGVHVVANPDGLRLQVDGKDFLIKGMNWDYFPLGTNYAYDFWGQPDDFIIEALGREMGLLQRMGVNAVRLYTGIPTRWITYIYEHFGIYTVLNHTVGRYGFTLDGVWIPSVDYSDPRLRTALKGQLSALVDQYRNTPGLLMWLLGNENNYGLSWSSFEIEALPKGERDTARARHLYSLFGEIIRDVKSRDSLHPVAIANGDLQYIDLIAEECKGLDVLGGNVYRGVSSGDLFEVVQKKLGIPFMYTEFGSDAFDAKALREDDLMQARYLMGQWREIYEQSAGKGRVGNAIGGFIFQWSDGWWKFGQESRLEIHDTNASWPDAAYKEDFVEGDNNMNEEWWGICAKGPPDDRGLYTLSPRTAFYALQQAFLLDPYAPSTNVDVIRAHYGRISIDELAFHYRADHASETAGEFSKVRLSGMRLSAETISTGGSRIDTAPVNLGFDRMESATIDFTVQPTERVSAMLSLNILGNVARNPIDQIYYETRGLPVRVACAERPGDVARCVAETGSSGRTFQLQGLDRLRMYKSSVTWDDAWFKAEGFYRTGHYHWGYEGDFFGVYREANYGANIDTYNADAPVGIEVAFKKQLEGLKVAFGPQLWWGANPALIAKYRTQLGRFDVTGIFQETFTTQGSVVSSLAIPELPTRKATLALATKLGAATVEFGGIWSGSAREGATFRVNSDTGPLEDKVVASDTLGGKARVTYESGILHWYGQAAYMGLVAEGGPTQAITFTGWGLKDSGSGNQVNALTGLAVNLGTIQIGPNLLWQKPLVGPGPSVSPSSPLRSILTDPFAVRWNRETIGAELLLVYDPTPATWMWAWDNDLREDADFAASVDISWRHLATGRDAGIGFLAGGQIFAFPGSTPPRDLWEAQGRFVSKLGGDFRLVGHFFVGQGEPNGDSQRLTHRYGGDFRLTWKSLSASAFAKFNDWGPYDYHRDFNLTFPLQVMGDVAYTLGAPRWLWVQQTRLGLRGSTRWLNAYSPRFVADGVDPTAWGNEWEVRAYLVVTL